MILMEQFVLFYVFLSFKSIYLTMVQSSTQWMTYTIYMACMSIKTIVTT